MSGAPTTARVPLTTGGSIGISCTPPSTVLTGTVLIGVDVNSVAVGTLPGPSALPDPSLGFCSVFSSVWAVGGAEGLACTLPSALKWIVGPSRQYSVTEPSGKKTRLTKGSVTVCALPLAAASSLK